MSPLQERIQNVWHIASRWLGKLLDVATVLGGIVVLCAGALWLLGRLSPSHALFDSGQLAFAPGAKDSASSESRAAREVERQLSAFRKSQEFERNEERFEIQGLRSQLNSLTSLNSKGVPSASASKPSAAPSGESNVAVRINVFYATDRKRTGDPLTNLEAAYGAQRATAVQYGICSVSLPLTHHLGDLERPRTLFFGLIEFGENPAKHVMLRTIMPKTEGAFWTDLLGDLNGTTGKRLLIFIHGYNVSFADAARRTGQLAWDLGFRGSGADSRGSAVFYSWPSLGKPEWYTNDEANADWTQGDFSQFLTKLLRSPGFTDLYVIAHSMGTRPALNALVQLVQAHPEMARRIHEIVLAAPDYDADTFRSRIAPAFGPGRLTGTLYVSSRDKALGYSKTVHGYPRLGDPSAGPVVVSGIETLDASAVDDGDFFGHSYFADRSALLEDLFELVVDGKLAANRFGLASVNSPRGAYWKFVARGK